MAREDGLPPGTLVMLILRVLASQPLHGYAVARRIAELSKDELSVEEGSLKGWVKASPAVSETGRQVREYRITASGSRQLDLERQNFTRISHAIMTILETA